MPWTQEVGWVMFRPHDGVPSVAMFRNREINVWKGKRRSTPVVVARSKLVECGGCIVNAMPGALCLYKKYAPLLRKCKHNMTMIPARGPQTKFLYDLAIEFFARLSVLLVPALRARRFLDRRFARSTCQESAPGHLSPAVKLKNVHS